jgi:hypothetical protein
VVAVVVHSLRVLPQERAGCGVRLQLDTGICRSDQRDQMKHCNFV